MSLNTILATTPLTSTGYHLKATGTTIGNSLIWDNGTNVGIGNTNTSYTLDVSGTGRFTGQLIANSTSFPLDVYGTTNNYGLRINNVQAATLFLYSSNANAASRNWGLFTNSEVYGDFDIRQSNAINGDLTNGANSTSRFYIKNNGNVGIGTSSPNAKLNVVNDDGVGSGLHIIADFNRNTSSAELILGYYADGTNVTTNAVYSANSLPLAFYTGATERMRITSVGDIRINAGSYYSGAGCVNTIVSSASDFCYSGANTNATNPRGVFITFPNSTAGDFAYYLAANAASKFYVTGNGVIYSTNTSVQAISDARHKENIRDLDKGLSEILLLKPRLFDWKEGKGTGNKNVMGFIAQEVESIFPELISDWKETIDATESFKTIAMSNIIPYLTKAVQEQQIQIQNLQEQINILAK